MKHEIAVFNCAACGVSVETARSPLDLGYRCGDCQEEPIVGDATKGDVVIRCDWCGVLAWAERASAKYCSTAHKKAAYKARKKFSR